MGVYLPQMHMADWLVDLSVPPLLPRHSVGPDPLGAHLVGEWDPTPSGDVPPSTQASAEVETIIGSASSMATLPIPGLPPPPQLAFVITEEKM